MFDMMYAPDNILKQMEELHHQYFIILADDMPAGYLSIEKTGENTYNFQKIYSPTGNAWHRNPGVLSSSKVLTI